jgi:hypothetical protein
VIVIQWFHLVELFAGYHFAVLDKGHLIVHWVCMGGFIGFPDERDEVLFLEYIW